jgi:hypothetical protein
MAGGDDPGEPRAAPGLTQTMKFPFITGLRTARAERDAPALAIVLLILIYTIFILMLPLSQTVQRAAESRFHLAGWSFASWIAFQPVPSMYNFENRWEVVFDTTTPGRNPSCPDRMSGFINHHVYNRLLLPGGRLWFENCAPATVRFISKYRGTTVETTYTVRHGPGAHGLIVSRPVQR